MGIKFNFFKALAGDSILVSTDRTNILIDGGYGETYEHEIQPELDNLESLDLVVLTHIDADHICGLIELVESDNENRKKIKELWFNSPKNIEVERTKNVKASHGQAVRFHNILNQYEIPIRNNICLINENSKQECCINNEINLYLLSPLSEDLEKLKKAHPENQKPQKCRIHKASWSASQKIDYQESSLNDIDTSSIAFGKSGDIENNSSIAFLMEYGSEKFLFLADADIEVINRSLITLGYSENKQLEVEFVKLSHHGSRNNINSDFLDIVKADKFIILTDGESKHNKHPNKDIFSLILEHKKREKHIDFIFNYKNIMSKILTSNDKQEYSNKSNNEYTFNIYNQNIFPDGVKYE